MQYITKIPPAVTTAEHNDSLSEPVGFFRVVHEPTGQVIAEGLRPREVIEATWLHSGRDYALRPRLQQLTPENGSAQTELQQVVGLFGPEWDVYIKAGTDEPWHRSGLSAYGITEREAVIRLFEEGFARGPWLPEYDVDAIK